MKRRALNQFWIPVLLASLLLGGCGFKLRGSNNFAFQTIAIQPSPGGVLAQELRRSFGGAVRVLEDGVGSAQTQKEPAQVILDVLQEQREKVVVGVGTAGQVREFQLRLRLKFRLRTPEGKELIPVTEIQLQRDISFNETAVLAKETEEGLLYRDMQTDIVQQLLRRLAAVQAL